MPLDPVEAVKQALGSVYAGVAAGDAERLAPYFTDDALVFGLGPTDTYNLRDLFLARLAQSLGVLGAGGGALELTASRPVVGLDEGAQSAWVYDLPRVELRRKSGSSTWLPRLTAHAVLQGARWRFDALHVSLGVPDAVVFAPEAAKKLVPPTDVGSQRARDSEQVVGLTRRLLDDFGVKIDRTSERDEFVQIGSSPTEVFERGKAFKDLARPQLTAIRKGGYSWRLEGNLRTGMAPGARSGWAAGNVVLRIGAGKKQQVLPPFRTLWIYVEEKGVWNLASEHQSLALPEDLREPAQATGPQPATNGPQPDAGVPHPGIGVW